MFSKNVLMIQAHSKCNKNRMNITNIILTKDLGLRMKAE